MIDGGKQKDGENEVSGEKERVEKRGKKRWQQTNGKNGRGTAGPAISWCVCCGRRSEVSRDMERRERRKEREGGGIKRRDKGMEKPVEKGKGVTDTGKCFRDKIKGGVQAGEVSACVCVCLRGGEAKRLEDKEEERGS